MRRIVRHIRILWRSESLLTELRIAAATRKAALLICAALVAAFALGMLNFAAFLALQPLWGAPLAALSVALADLVGAGVLLVYAQSSKAGAETTMLREVRDLALQDLEAEAAGFEAELGKARDQVKDLVQHPLGSIAPSIVLPLLKSVIGALRTPAKK